MLGNPNKTLETIAIVQHPERTWKRTQQFEITRSWRFSPQNLIRCTKLHLLVPSLSKQPMNRQFLVGAVICGFYSSVQVVR